MAITPRTKDADDELRKKLKNADIGKFKDAVKKVLRNGLAPTNKQEKPN